MKLTYIANIRLPTERAHGIQIMSMAEAFANAGAEVTLVVSKRKTAITEDPFSFYGIKKNFKLERIGAIDFTHYGHIFRALAYHIERITFARNALRYARENPADIFYTRDELTFVRFAKAGLPVVVELHTLSQKLYLYQEAFARSKKIVVISSHLKDALITNGVPAEKIIVAHDGVDVSKFNIEMPEKEARAKYGLPENAFIALYAGLLDEWKGYKTLLEGSDELAQNGIQTVIVGGTDTQVATLKTQYPKATFLGFKKYEEIPFLHRAANAIVIPNSARFDISRLYTSPLKLFQAMASSAPVVSSDLPSLREVLSESTAVFFKPDDSTSLVQALISLKNDPQKGVRLILEAHDTVRNYSWLKRAQTILQAIHA